MGMLYVYGAKFQGRLGKRGPGTIKGSRRCDALGFRTIGNIEYSPPSRLRMNSHECIKGTDKTQRVLSNIYAMLASRFNVIFIIDGK